jgi:glucose-1-phosphate cytidylyltransferase
MKHYSHYGYNDFIICLGYKGYVIKEYFAHYFLHESDVTFDFRSGNERTIHTHAVEPWRVTLVDTGMETMTGGRVRRVRRYLEDGPFLLTYGDGVADIDIRRLVEFHRAHGKVATVSAAQPGGRFGALDFTEGDQVRGFMEKPVGDGGWINAGFFVMQPQTLDYIDGDATVLEREPMERLSRDGQLMAYRHSGFWQPMDTLREKNQLEALWRSGKAPWKVWA